MTDKLTIYFTSDTHGYLYPTDFCSEQPRPMGLLSMSFPKDENTLIIDGGDTIQGSPLTYFCYSQGETLPMAAALNRLSCDYVTLGNHDFNHGPRVLADYLSSLSACCLCANVSDAEGRLPLAPYTVHVLGNGLRVGLIGIVTPWINRWEKKENLAGITVSDPLEAARDAATALSGRVDILVGIYHGGIERDLATGRLFSETDENIACRLCEEIPFDLLLTGHQHMALEQGRWKNTVLVQPPANATHYVKVTMDANKHFASKLCPVSPTPLIPSAETDLFSRLNRWLDQPVGHLSRPLPPGDHLEMALHGSSIADFFNRVQLSASGADVSCSCLANSLRGFNAAVTVRDAVASYPFANTLVVLDVTGSVLRQALEQCATYFTHDENGKVRISDPFLLPKEAHYNYAYFAGIEYTFDLSRPAGSRVVSLTRNGLPVQPADHLSLVMNDYRAAGSGDFDFYRSCPRLRDIQTEMSELLLDYLQSHDLIDLPESHPVTCINYTL